MCTLICALSLLNFVYSCSPQKFQTCVSISGASSFIFFSVLGHMNDTSNISCSKKNYFFGNQILAINDIIFISLAFQKLGSFSFKLFGNRKGSSEDAYAPKKYAYIYPYNELESNTRSQYSTRSDCCKIIIKNKSCYNLCLLPRNCYNVSNGLWPHTANYPGGGVEQGQKPNTHPRRCAYAQDHFNSPKFLLILKEF